MKYFVAGVELADLAGIVAGLVGGAVTDALAVAAAAERAGRPPAELLGALARAVGGPIIVDVPPAAADVTVASARAFAPPGGPVVARVPFGAEGLAAIRACVGAGVRMAASGCVTPLEALEAARAGSAWISPPAGLPVADLFAMLRKTIALFEGFELPTQVLVGPVRDPGSLVDVAMAGAHAAAVPPAVLREISAPLGPRGASAKPAGP